MSRNLPTLLSLPLLGSLMGCDPLLQVVPDQSLAEPELVQQALGAARPGPLLALPGAIEALLDTTGSDTTDSDTAGSDAAGCPRIDVLEFSEDGEPVREVWTGGCTTADGTLIEGVVEIHTSASGQWMAGEGFTVSRGEEVELYFDGAIESIEQDELLLVEAAATWCGGLEAPCSDDAVTVDLTYSIYPAAGYPDTYDITVSGVVAPDAPITVEGSWSINIDACAAEPTDGAFALQRGDRHDLGMDGALSCDGCAAWTVQGLDAPPYCGVEL